MSTAAPRITYYVVLFKQAPDSGGAIRPIARLLKDEEETVRQKLLTPAFEVLSRFAKRDNAEGQKNQLFALGIDTIIVSDQDVRGHLFVGAAKGSKGAGGIAFRDFEDKPLYVPFDDITRLVMMEVPRADGTTATIIDLHRRSTSITPRLDAAHFDFPALMGAAGAGLEDFLTQLERRCSAQVDRRFGLHREAIVRAAHDFGSRPTEFAPPASRLTSPYDATAMLAASLWSFLLFSRDRQA